MYVYFEVMFNPLSVRVHVFFYGKKHTYVKSLIFPQSENENTFKKNHLLTYLPPHQ